MEEVQKQRRRRTLTTVAVVVLLIAVIVGGIYAFTRGPSSGLPAYLDICVSGAGRFYHGHPHLSIVVNGQNQPVPASVGVEGGCLRPLHTHDASGTIHVEPDDGSHPDYTLGDFFLIWRQVLNETQVLGFKAVSPNTIMLTVNDVAVAGPPQNYVIPRNAGTSSEPCSPGPSCQQVNMVITLGPASS